MKTLVAALLMTVAGVALACPGDKTASDKSDAAKSASTSTSDRTVVAQTGSKTTAPKPSR
jgi:hypothetical protein